MKRVGINGFGRIGRLALRVIMEKYSDQIEVPIINTSGKMDAKGWAHIFEFDTMYRRFHGSVEVEGEDTMIINGHRIHIHGDKEPANIPWGDYQVETVIESTGAFTDEEGLRKHLRDGVNRVVLSAPAKGGDIQTVVLGINDQEAEGKQLLSNASCTTNCVSPVTQVILDKFGIEKAAMTTVHAYTSDQSLHDGSHRDLRRARAAAQNVIPTSTGAAIATTEVIPQLKDKFDGIAIRVPVATGSLTDFTFIVSTRTTVEEVNNAFSEASESERFKHYLWVTKKPIVSSDVIGCEASALVDLSLTQVIDGDLVKVYAWYDNEWGYTNRLVEQLLK
ncbi:type I glyceraldehyde-3-phosphate dehydrogenase [Candidatus Beckwithbacteria bacterium]|nr:type I glyceraldehyde-3-phosphate dehydrogenase [Candidatus Beckwithbacteria bacterium]